MDRFFSKLDLRDIKIDPERSNFSPNEEFDPETVADAQPSTRIEPEPNHHANELDAAEEDWAPATAEMPATNHHEDSAPVSETSDVLKVSSKSRPSAVAGAIAGVVREMGRAEVQAIGAGATNQAIKAVAIARDYLSETGIDAICVPAFIDITIDNEDRTAIRIVIEPR
jgi:stage V sporulation protein S